MAMESTAPRVSAWHGKPYYSLDAWCKNTYGRKLFKVALEAGCTCPNRDGTISTGGCIFCSAGGSGDFAVPPAACVHDQLEAGKNRLAKKWRIPSDTPCLIAYFQSYTNTYGDPAGLLRLFGDALAEGQIAGISIATRPDCLPAAILSGLDALQKKFPDKFIWIELGLQTIHDQTAVKINRGYSTSIFYGALQKLRLHGLPVIVHVILGLPGESKDDILATIHAINLEKPFGIKLQLLHILNGTVLADLYTSGAVRALEETEYLDLVTDCIAALSPGICIHRVTGDGPKQLLLAPLWSLHKRNVLNGIHACMKQKGIRQGVHYESGTSDTL